MKNAVPLQSQISFADIIGFMKDSNMFIFSKNKGEDIIKKNFFHVEMIGY